MFRIPMAAAVLAAWAMQAAADPPRVEQAGVMSANVPSITVSPERVAKIRQALLKQIAVYDQGEGAMRAPSVREAAALAGSSVSSAATAVALPGGGLALRADASSLSFLVVDQREDGRRTLRHASPVPSHTSQGGAHGR